MSVNISVGISDWKINKGPGTLITYALGSCVGICLYDKNAQIGGLSHIMLPESTSLSEATSINRMKFADTAIPDMLSKMLNMGAVHNRITAKITGGALMFAASSEKFNIGDRNVASVKNTLAKLKIPIVAQDTGSNYGRTVYFHTDNGEVEVKSTTQGTKVI